MKTSQMSQFATAPKLALTTLAAASLFLATAGSVLANRFVDPYSPGPAPPYTSWVTAAHTIQEAIDAAGAGEIIVVTNGTYASGGRAVFGTMTNRVVVDKPLTLRSANGPQFTVIRGYQAPGDPTGLSAIRCVYLTNGASLSGFKLTAGATHTTGDNDHERSGGGVWCESTTALVTNCVIYANQAGSGAGAYSGTLESCALQGNRADYGGGARYSVLNGCLVLTNSANYYGGGVADSTLNNCSVAGNSAVYGGGTFGGTLNNCIVCWNFAVTNADNNYYGSILNNSCTTPMPPTGLGNIASDPLFSGFWDLHLQSNSPCINAGTNASVFTGTDLDGHPRIVDGTVDMGAYEYQGSVLLVAPYIASQPDDQTVTAGSNATFTMTAGGSQPLAYWWRFNGANLNGPTTNSLTLINVQPANAGIYFVVISNTAGSATSRVAILTVLPPVTAGTHYVDATGANPTSPYTNWATAAQTIQDAIDVAAPGNEIVVTNGVYATGGRAVYGTLLNRVAVNKAVKVRSVSGPQFTLIQGYQVPGTTNGDGAVRCVYLANGASLIGFTLTNGATRHAGDFLTEQCGGALWCGATGIVSVTAMVSNCVLTGNAAANAGGAVYQGTLYDCTLAGNSAANGGGQAWATLSNCTLTANTAISSGGGGAYGQLSQCTLTGNSAANGGGQYAGTLHYCTLTGNWANNSVTNVGGGAAYSSVNNCLLTGNTAPSGGGAYSGTLSNCTLYANSAASSGGGAYGSTLENCILYFNSAPSAANYGSAGLYFCCTTPLPSTGAGNVAADPLFVNAAAGNLRLQSNSPCINAGVNDAIGGIGDLDGNPRISSGVVDIGAYEYQGNLAPVIVSQPASQAVLAGTTVTLSVTVRGTPPLSYQWSFAGSPLLGATNAALILTDTQVGQSGNYWVTVTNLAGSITSSNALLQVTGLTVHYVDAGSANPVAPYTSWSTAALTIQQAVDVSAPTEEIVVTNGIYAAGGRTVYGALTNRVAVTKPLTVRSVNGPQFTVIQGYQLPGTTNGDSAVRCVYLTNGAFLIGFTLTNGATRTTGDQFREWCGGGLWCESNSSVVSNCVLAGNCAFDDGGGAYGGTLNNCTLSGNSAANLGGGLSGGTANNCLVTGNSSISGGGSANSKLYNCTVTGNSAAHGGGAYGLATNSILLNCIIYYNTAPDGSNYLFSQLSYCCTTPVSPNGFNNISSEPQFIDPAGNLRLQPGSPCINTGFNNYAPGTNDLDGHPRIIGGTVDIGAYEFVESGSGAMHYVNGSSANPISPYITWATAATTIQAAVDAAVAGDNIVVTNGTYNTGGRAVYDTMTNRVAVDRPVTVRSVNGPQFTVIQGYQVPRTTNGDGAIRCVYLTDGASLSGFTLTNGATLSDGDYRANGGGVWCESSNAMVINCVLAGNSAGLFGGAAYSGTLSNSILTGNSADYGGGAFSSVLNGCTLTGNSARAGGGAFGATLNTCILSTNSAGTGGGASSCTLNNCTLAGNVASEMGGASIGGTLNNCLLVGNRAGSGGGAAGGKLKNCTLVGNSATNSGGGAYGFDTFMVKLPSILNNCIVYYNLAPYGPNSSGSTQYDCCMPDSGFGNITNEPVFVDRANGDFHLQPNSPCINAGNNAYVSSDTDLDGNPRIIGSTVDIGAYEFIGSGSGAVHYVNGSSANPTSPFLSWATAATTIQAAVDAAAAGDDIVVTNGTYATGGRAVGTMTNRVAVDRPVIVRSVHGPQFTVIQGYQLPGTTNGDGAIRCVYLTNGASLIGFTLTGGATRSAGDLNREQSGGGVLCESSTAIVSNCVVTGNSASYGGGSRYGTLNNCSLIGNTAYHPSTFCGGGGAMLGTLINCLLTRNSTTRDGGGADAATLINCTLAGNHAGWGGGAANCQATNCILYFNTASYGDNFYNNSGGFGEAYIAYCCTAPQPYNGIGNITSDPLFVDLAGGDFRLKSGSPCINAGNNALAPTGTDLDGNPRIFASIVDLGAYERQVPGFPIAPYIILQPTDQTAHAGANATFSFTGGGSAPLGYQWSFGGSPLAGATNASLTLTNVSLSQAGTYALTITNLAGAITTSNALLTVTLTRYVDANSTTPTPPFTNWATAAATIQEAVDVSGPGDDILVNDGLYATGGRAVYGAMTTNRVAVDRAVILHSVNGPQFTVIQGYQLPGTTNGDGVVRCVYLTNGASLIGFTLTGGATRSAGDLYGEQSGGGILCEILSTAIVSNCVVTGNSAGYQGGGATGCTMNNCWLTGNVAPNGGGAFLVTLNNCILSGNSARAGGGAYGGTLNNCTVVGNSGIGAYGWYVGKSGQICTLNNCILYYNDGGNYNTYAGLYSMSNCCTTPSSWGSGNITNEPVFVDLANGDFHLQPSSPCINAGTNLYVSTGTDLDGQSRIVGGTVDMGAYEFQGIARPSFQAWLQQYGLPTDGSADYVDSDGDGMNNWQEWRGGTNPTNALSVLRLLPPVSTGNNVAVSWQSVGGVRYNLERSTNLAASPAFTLLATNLPGQMDTNFSGQAGTTSYTDTNAAAAPRLFYRIGVP